MVKFLIANFCLLIFFILGQDSRAASLTYVSDLISSSEISVGVDHTITFTVTNQIPAGGKIVITPEADAFNIPAGMDYTDIDFLVAQTPGNYVDRNIGPTPSVSEDGISITTGINGNITINLNTAVGVSAGNQVKILVGNNASFQVAGDQRITSPSTEDSYSIDIRTESGGNNIDTSRTFIATVMPVSLSAEKTEGPPTMFNGNPSGDFSHTVTAVEIWLSTNEDAVCKYSTVPGQSYSAMPNVFSISGNLLHRTVVSGLGEDSAYSYYVKCADSSLNIAPLDLVISFNIKPSPPEGTIPGPVGGPEGAGGAPVVLSSGLSGLPYPTDKASLLFNGLAFPSGKVYILKDGVSVGTALANIDSKFSFNLNDLSRGIYTFSFYALDVDGNKSNTSNATFSLISNSGNQISNIRIPPTMTLASKNIDPGSPLEVSGYTISNSSVELIIYNKISPATPAMIEKINPDTSGKWSANIDTKDLANGNYQLRARALVPGLDPTAFTHYQSFGIGVDEIEEEISPGNPDLNGDGKVNLIDFSILLFNWGDAGGGTASDLNADGTVNLTDFSILLFNWTG